MDIDDKLEKAIQNKGCPFFSSLGIVITIPAIFLAVMSGGAGHGHYTFARLFFPFPMVLSALVGSIELPFLGIAVIQFPLYGLILDTFRARGRFLSGALALTAFHLVFLLLCFTRIVSNFS